MELHRYQTQIKLYKIDYYQINGGLVSMVCNKNGKRQDLTPFLLTPFLPFLHCFLPVVSSRKGGNLF